ncbi:MAG TPA: macro domain-containing protein [Terriglobales bacterium]|nr:macro domain-containing protein [Terriglobales bacterium]
MGAFFASLNRAGGLSILAECKIIVTQIGRLAPGKAVITAAGRLPAKFVIHTVGPIYRNGKRGEPETLASAHRESIRLTTPSNRSPSQLFPPAPTATPSPTPPTLPSKPQPRS